ncbi:XdhC family protein [Lutibaculum baratangense]|uniref:Aerobic carbon monoxide dehydrogenase molybdenum cofactor insertion protein CoxF n=1 Tax=Lutibaculum baratangense AMV1 TaxID=631454 RepID=V4RK44_9HYPH|nr:XdhC family protein [Lutibaculum baratangense]ESR25704.1 Aerobic carbon monoxide dehydrogenase molybdenum cofactor insertion protein CoxF [Lutibaculum baratangense AMV1]
MTQQSRFDKVVDELREQGRAFAIATVVRTVAATAAKPGAKAVVLDDGTIAEGWIGGGCARGAVAKAALEAIGDGRPRFVSLMPEELLEAGGLSAGEEREGVRFARNRCPSKGSMDVFVEPVTPRPELMICGESPVALALADLSGRLDVSRTLCAPGLPAAKAPPVDRLLDGFTLDTTGRKDRFAVVATQGKGDEAALRAAVSAGASYIGFVGSRRKFAALRDRLVSDGLPPDALDAVKCPAGLDIAAITPDEIALSILAEIVAHRRMRQRSAAMPDGEASAGRLP